MLQKAFLETADYAALTQSKDRTFVVGRRGTGKSALFTRVSEFYRRQPQTFVLAGHPHEYETIRIQHLLGKIDGSYSHMRAAARVAWSIHILKWVADEVRGNYKAPKSEHFPYLEAYTSRHRSLANHEVDRCADILASGLQSTDSAADLPGVLARSFDLRRLEDSVRGALADIGWAAIVLYDGLDEGWTPEAPSVAVLDGLTSAISDLAEHGVGVHGLLFIRDNMFRALAHLHPDFSRQVEGSTQRLHWDEATLFELVCSRLRARFAVHAEQNERVWNSAVGSTLAGRDGFERCLHHTLYRPRDVLVLLNAANDMAARRGESAITLDSVDRAATQISENRLADLLKEYHAVLPGLRSFVLAFERRPAISTYGEMVAHLDYKIGTGVYDALGDSDFAVFGTGKQVLSALYGVGFVGFEDPLMDGQYTFCHDGSRHDPEDHDPKTLVAVHPCYWRALELEMTDRISEFVVRINDDYDVPGFETDVQDLRVRQIGRALSEFPNIPLGPEGASEFEEWVLRAVRILFASKLANPELHPNPASAPQRRDIVATNMAKDGIWRRIFEDFDTRQVLFEVKNYSTLKVADYRQALSYMTSEHGRLGVLVYRSEQDGVASPERTWLREMYHEHDRVVFTIPIMLLRKGIAKMRNPDRFDWIENQLGRRLDKFQRNYLKITH